MSQVAVVDTNVVAAGLMTARPDAPTARILDGMLGARFPFALSTALLAEHRSVLNRPAPRRRHGLDADELEALLLAGPGPARHRADARGRTPTPGTSTCGLCWPATPAWSW